AAGGRAALPPGDRAADPAGRRPGRRGGVRLASRHGVVSEAVPRRAAGGRDEVAGRRRADRRRGALPRPRSGAQRGSVIEPGTSPRTLEALEEVARAPVGRTGGLVRLAGAARERMRASRATIERAIRGGAPVYGVTTGFGELKDQRIPEDQVRELQMNLVR